MVIATATDCTFDQFSVSVWDSSMVAIASQKANAVEVGGCNFVLWLFDSTEGFACAFDVIGSQRCTMATEGEDCSACIRWSVDDVLLARVARTHL